MTTVSQGKKLKAERLIVLRQGNAWFWQWVNAFSLAPLLQTGYENISHGLITVLSERWHVEANSFHLPDGEMTVTLDDVACLLDIRIVGRLIAEEDIDRV